MCLSCVLETIVFMVDHVNYEGNHAFKFKVVLNRCKCCMTDT